MTYTDADFERDCYDIVAPRTIQEQSDALDRIIADRNRLKKEVERHREQAKHECEACCPDALTEENERLQAEVERLTTLIEAAKNIEPHAASMLLAERKMNEYVMDTKKRLAAAERVCEAVRGANFTDIGVLLREWEAVKR